MFQSTLPVRGATQQDTSQQRGEGFQSTLPVRGATRQTEHQIEIVTVSIHAPREGSDTADPTDAGTGASSFNPRSP